jgi:hypothetical protein
MNYESVIMDTDYINTDTETYTQIEQNQLSLEVSLELSSYKSLHQSLHQSVQHQPSLHYTKEKYEYYNNKIYELKLLHICLKNYIKVYHPFLKGNDEINGFMGCENTYLFEKTINNKFNDIISLLNLLHYKNENWLSRYHMPIQALSCKKRYAFVRLNENNELIFCRDKYCIKCTGILFTEE